MAKITIMSGLPASGKSTRAQSIIAERGNTIRINKDLIRTMLHFDKFNGLNEGRTQDASRKLADWFLSNNINIIIDDTNLNPNTVQQWKDFAKIHNAVLEYENLDTDLVECIKRNSTRDRKVPTQTIIQMAVQYKGFYKERRVIVCDIDGTLADISHRLQYAQGDTKDWDKFFSLAPTDTFRKEIWAQVCSDLESEQADDVVLVSARPETYRQETEKWLAKYAVNHGLLFMRPEDDKREDSVIKEEIYNKFLKNMTVVRVFDDRPRVIKMWRAKGLDVVDVGTGVEF